MNFKEKLSNLAVGEGERIVARFDLSDGVIRFTLASEHGTSWVYVWDNPMSPTDIRSFAHVPARNAKEANSIESYIRKRCKEDRETLAQIKI